jgi:hypothetical protein
MRPSATAAAARTSGDASSSLSARAGTASAAPGPILPRLWAATTRLFSSSSVNMRSSCGTARRAPGPSCARALAAIGAAIGSPLAIRGSSSSSASSGSA